MKESDNIMKKEETENPLVSIIVPVYNVEKYIEESLKSIINQTYKKIEIIVVDDGGSDSSICLAEDMLSNCRLSYKVIHQENRGLPGARNTGLRHAQGKYVCFIDSDDIISDCHIEKLVQIIESRKVNVAFSDFEFTSIDNRSGKRTIFCKEEVLDQKHFLYKFVRRKPAIHCCALMINRTFLDTYFLYFNENLNRYGEDIEFMWRLFIHTEQIGHVKEKTYKYLIRKNSIMTSPDSRKWHGFLPEFYKTINNEAKENHHLKHYLIWAYYRTIMGWLGMIAESSDYGEFYRALSHIDMKKLNYVMKRFPDIRTRLMLLILNISNKTYFIIFKYRRNLK